MAKKDKQAVTKAGENAPVTVPDGEVRTEKESRVKSRHILIGLAVLFGVAALVLTGVSVAIRLNAISEAADDAAGAFSAGFSEKSGEVREAMGAKGFEDGFEDFRTVNDVTIRLEDVRKTAKLEVMKVSSVVYIHDTGALEGKVVAWLKVSGTGVYTVDMTAGEYVVDNGNRYVLVRVPEPELSQVEVTDKEKKLYRDKRWFTNGDPGQGVDLAIAQLAQAQTELTEDIRNNRYANDSLENNARIVISALVRSLNPDIPDLAVDVEFF